MKSTKAKLLLLLCSSLVLGISGCASTTALDYWVPPEGAVQDGKAAIAIAHAMWASMHPQLAVGSESEWQSQMVAEREGQVWHVHDKLLGPDEIGGSLYIDLSARDGRLLRISMTQ